MIEGIDLTDAEAVLANLPAIIAVLPGGLEAAALIRAKIAQLEATNPRLFSALHGLISAHLDQLGTGNINAAVNLILPEVPSSLDVPTAAAAIAKLATPATS